MADVARTFNLNSGYDIPVLGLGTFKAEKGEVGAAVKAALGAGYRLIDCAQAYGNQAEVGLALKEAFDESVCNRDEVFVVSKVFQTHHVWQGDPSRVHESLEQTLRDLQLEYLDLLLIHWPFAFEQKVLDFPLRLEDGSPNPLLNVEVEYLDTWKVLEGFVKDGLVKSIGVSNFTMEQLEYLKSNCEIPPAANQVEVHPYMSQRALRAGCAAAGIAVMAYSPLGSSLPKFPERHGATLLTNPTVQAIAADVGKSASQVLIRWSLQQGCVALPKSGNPGRISENGDVLSWSLSEEIMSRLDELNSDFRYFVSYLKKPDNNLQWHDGVVEHQRIPSSSEPSAL